MKCDILLQGGEVIDPSQELHTICDIAIAEGRVAAVEEDLSHLNPVTRVDARGLLVTPGLIDMHVHVYPHTSIGLDADQLCLSGGVTTMLDAGSAGSLNFNAFRKTTIDQALPRILALVNLSCIGLLAPHLGELMDPRYADPDGVKQALVENPDVAVGVKIRAGRHIIGEGRQGWENLKAAVRAARETQTWLMVHIGECPFSIPELLELLSPGDCVTHCFKAGSTRILDDKHEIFDSVQVSVERGVVFDVGHGFGSFHWDVAERALADGFVPTTISTDLHQKNLHGPVYDLPTTMSKMLALGIPLHEVIAMATSHPARVLERSDLGNLRVGSPADITLLERREGSFLLTDSYEQTREANELLGAAATIRNGKLLPGGSGLRMRELALTAAVTEE